MSAQQNTGHSKIPAFAVVFSVAAVIAAIAISFLTQQPPAETVSESNMMSSFIISVLGHTPLYDPERDLWAGIDIRHWAHTAEFLVFGIFSTLAVWFCKKPKIAVTGGISLAICALFSLVDQCHRLFVPGRHFDPFDLTMDALGYGLAIMLVLTVSKIASPARRRPAA